MSTKALNVDELIRRPGDSPALSALQRVCMVVLMGAVLWAEGRSQPWVWWGVLFFGVSAAIGLWRSSTGRPIAHTSLTYYWSSALIVLMVARGTEGGGLLLVLFLYPLTMCTVMHGIGHGLALAAVSAATLLLDLSRWRLEPLPALPALAMLLIPLIATLIGYPMAALRQRNELVDELERQIDARRGLVAVGLEVGARLRTATAARRVLVCHRDAEVPTVLVCDAEDGAFAASEALSSRVLSLLSLLPAVSQVFGSHSGGSAGRPDRVAANLSPEDEARRELAQLLEAHLLYLIPDAPGKAHTGWILVAYGPDLSWRNRPWPLPPLAGFASDTRRLLQQASYVDRLQEEIAAHARSRIGRDLHDSAIQPYLGLKFAIEGLALRCDPANPLHAQVQELRAVCDTELVELRKTVSALRAGEASGEHSLATSLQQQCGRFARLFALQIDLQVPSDLQVSRRYFSALLHMVNEALNNVRRHTLAQQVWIHLAAVPGGLELSIRDDAGQRSGKAAPDFEPRSLAERARELGGTLEVRRRNGLDTEIRINLPS